MTDVTDETVTAVLAVVAPLRHRPSVSDRYLAEQAARAAVGDTPTPQPQPREQASDALAFLRQWIPTLTPADLDVIATQPVAGIIRALKAPCRACGADPVWWDGADHEDAPRAGKRPLSEEPSEQGDAA